MANKIFIDTSSIQYAPWRFFMAMITPHPALKVQQGRSRAWLDINEEVTDLQTGEPYRPERWYTEPITNFIEDEDGVVWYFDAIIRMDHNQSQRITQHPVQDGASIADHSFSLPAKLSMEIGMSDVMGSFVPGQWSFESTGSVGTRSQAAYQKLLAWKNAGMPLQISTRLDLYTNMVVETISAPDDVFTFHGLKCNVTFQQIFISTVQSEQTGKLPTRKNVVTETKKGPIPAQEKNSILSGR